MLKVLDSRASIPSVLPAINPAEAFEWPGRGEGGAHYHSPAVNQPVRQLSSRSAPYQGSLPHMLESLASLRERSWKPKRHHRVQRPVSPNYVAGLRASNCKRRQQEGNDGPQSGSAHKIGWPIAARQDLLVPKKLISTNVRLRETVEAKRRVRPVRLLRPSRLRPWDEAFSF